MITELSKFDWCDKMKIVGLTGNSGCGKGTVAEIMAEYGAVILDCDKIAHKNMEPDGIAYNEIKDAFGKEILNGDNTINRKKLATIVFKNKKSLEKLNDITHKYIVKVIDNEININRNKKCVVIDAPLLIEAGLNRKCNFVWAVHAPLELRIERVMNRDHIDRESVLMRFKNQMDFEEIRTYADVVIENSAGLDKLRKKVVENMNNEELI